MHLMDRQFRPSLLALAIIATASPLRGQRAKLTPYDIAQITDEALRVVVPSDSTFSGVSVARRGIAFDLRRTLAAFGSATASDSAVRLQRHADIVSHDVLSDCSQMAPMPCARLGSRVYVLIEPLSVTKPRAHVRVNVFWPDRGKALARSSGDHAYLTGFSAKIHLARNADGAWIFQKRDRSVLVM